MIGQLEDFSGCMGYSKNYNGIIKGSKCNHISILKGPHQDLDTIKVRKYLGQSVWKTRLQLFLTV